ncbi:MAG: septum formation protein Maf [Bacteroidales bacterium]|nr:septum formation protein Maf [Bacteroidales bacterium]MBR4239327.1 septum formation protein Maf [Prevotella sp.]
MKTKLILASNSPRRKELLGGLGIPFEVRVLQGIDESYPETVPTDKIAEFIATNKAKAYEVAADEILITADTVVIVDDEILGKPADADDARQMLRKLSGKSHHVITGVSLKSYDKQKTFSVDTEVTFKTLSESEIDYYVTRYKPFDKAGAYGIQEWIGYIGVTSLRGSYFNVVGFPVQRIYDELCKSFHFDISSLNSNEQI